MSGGYAALEQLGQEISKAQGAGATVAALAMVYVAIDTMALLACPAGQTEQTKGDFVAWVDTYLKADPASDYQYEGRDVYAARCAVLHSYGSVARDHARANPPRQFIYTDNGPHRKDDTERFALISITVLICDLANAMPSFLEAVLADPDLKRRVDSRIGNLFFSRPLG